MPDTDWVTITITASGLVRRVRCSTIVAYGAMPAPSTSAFIDLGNGPMTVNETPTQLAAALGDVPSVATTETDIVLEDVTTEIVLEDGVTPIRLVE